MLKKGKRGGIKDPEVGKSSRGGGGESTTVRGQVGCIFGGLNVFFKGWVVGAP